MPAKSASPREIQLTSPVTMLFGVGAERAAQLERLDIRTLEDLLLHRPARYEDRRHLLSIAKLQLHEPATVRGTVLAGGVKWFAKHTKSVFELILDDGTARLHCRWWNLPYMERYFAKGDEVIVYGRPLGLKPRTMDHPETEVIDPGEERFIHFNRITPVYPLTEGLPQRWLRGLIWRSLESFGALVVDRWTPKLPEAKDGPAVSPGSSGELALLSMTRAQAVRALHFPENPADAERARDRLALEEWVDLQRQIRERRLRFQSKATALPCGGTNELIRPLLKRLGFRLTEAQTQVLREIRKDMKGVHPMRRLLQGDVGSGKTVVAACAALMALECKFNAALMAPTEILAQQHYQTLRRWLEGFPVNVELHTGSAKTAFSGSRPDALDSKPSLFVGTHALVQDGFEVPDLGLVIIDEQHKFGVAQREEFLRKGHYPHLLVMTATPIPRTLGLTLYGDLDLSTIDQMPPGRGRIRTFVRDASRLPDVVEFVRRTIDQGRQAYVVYPRVEETTGGVKAVVVEMAKWQRNLAPCQCGLLHGRLRPEEKEAVMDAFRSNRVQVLLATSLIEVGVDVPNATLMLIENAEQFGLAQLHQLRGRIGRGGHESYCILMAGKNQPEIRKRLKVLEDTTDGFRIAEADLQLRGPGEMLGQQQSGVPKFKFADFATDLDLIKIARGQSLVLTVK